MILTSYNNMIFISYRVAIAIDRKPSVQIKKTLLSPL